MNKRTCNRLVPRRSRGNMLVLTSAVTVGLLVPLLLFALWYARMTGSHQEQTTAIQGAALAAADALGRIVIEDPQFGYVGLSDYGPVASNTQGLDGQDLPVRSINTILATIRIDMIIADQFNDPTMKAMAQKDYQSAMATKDYLSQQLQDAISKTPSQSYKDVDGNPVKPYASALAAYQQNIIRMNGTANQVDSSSFKLSLGCLTTPGGTDTPVPLPASMANVPTGSSCTESPTPGAAPTEMYKSYTNVSYDGLPFVFSACDYQLRLVDSRNFTTSVAGLPWAVPSVIKVDADQIYAPGRGNPSVSTVHAIACAQPANCCDPRPAPGALKLDFPDGSIPEIQKPGDILTSPITTTPTTTLQSPVTGDYPPAPLVPITGGMPITGTNPPVSTLGAVGIYDWIKRAGTRPNIAAVMAWKATPLSFASYPTQTAAFEWDPNGNILYHVLAAPPAGYKVPAANMQLYGKSKTPIKSSNGKSYDFTFSDTAIQPGRMIGGLHAGEPLADPTLAVVPLHSSTIACAESCSPIAIAYGACFCILPLLAFFRFRRHNVFAQPLSIASSLCLLTLTACGGAPPPPPADIVLTTSIVGPRTPRSTYTSNGMTTEMDFSNHVASGGGG